MSPDLPKVTVAMRADRRAEMIDELDLARLRTFADVRIEAFDAPSSVEAVPDYDVDAEARLIRLATESDALVVTHGSPRVTAAVLDAAPRVRFVGELEGDRFFGRIDVDAAQERGVTVVDTTHGSSWPVAEYALALAVFGLRDTGRFIRKMYDHVTVGNARTDEPERVSNRELTGRRVGLIGFGHIGWRLVELLRPFRVEIIAYDPYAPRELAEVCDVDFTDLDSVMATSDVVVCLAPLMDGTRGMIQEKHLRLMADGSTFVSVSRGPVIDSDALLTVAREGRIIFCLDVFEPEPIPSDSPFRDLPNVLLTPHLAGRTDECRPRYFALMVDELHRQFVGHEPRAQATSRGGAGRGGAAQRAGANR